VLSRLGLSDDELDDNETVNTVNSGRTI
jgi:hypothetical protein